MKTNEFSAHEIEAARQWWEHKGRRLMSKTINVDDTEGVTKSGGNAPAIRTTRVVDAKVPSGILSGLDWSALTGHEQRRVVYVFRYMTERAKYPERRNARDENHVRRLKLDGRR